MTITLLNGDTLDDSDISFDSSSQAFIDNQTGADIGDKMLFVDKRRIGGDAWNSNAYLDLNYRKHYQETHDGADPGGPKETNTAVILAEQLYNDPLGAPIDQAGKIFNNSFKALARNAPLTLTTLALIACAGYLIWKTGIWKKAIPA